MSAIRCEIEIEGPVLTAGLGTPAYGVDAGFQRDLNNKFILPGTLLKGVVAHMLWEISEAAPALLPEEKRVRWFGENTGDVVSLEGKPTGTGLSLEPRRGIVRFGDFRLVKNQGAETDKDKEPARLTRIAVDDDTGSVRRGMLQILESPLDYGEKGTFVGTLTVVGTSAEAQEIARWIKAALDLVPGLGSAKSAGFGQVVNVQCNIEEDKPRSGWLASDPDALAGERIGYALEFNEPVLVASQAISGNLFKSSEEIPGGVVKGALARAIEAAGALTPRIDAALDRMIIRHAKPVLIKKGDKRPFERPQAVPVSLFSVEDFSSNKKLTILDASDPDWKPEDWSKDGAILFPPDWKPEGKARKSVAVQLKHTADFRHDVRTRTAIKGEIAAESQLFSRVALSPDADPDEKTNEKRRHVWVGEILRGDADSAVFAEIVKIMQQGLPGIGKTGATAAVAFFEPEPHKAKPPAGAKPKPGYTRWRIALETDAQLHGPRAMFNYRGLGPEAQLNLQYRDYFADAINQRSRPGLVALDDLELCFFARQHWAGGYQALRFPGVKDQYYPHLVTEAGSVFVLDSPDAATPAIESFVTRGLPLPSTVPAADREFKRSPFVPQNGYGEVSIGNYFDWDGA